MARMKSLTSLDVKIADAQKRWDAARKKCEKAEKELLALQREKDAVQAAHIVAALKKSRRSYQELMTFLGR